MNKIKHILSGVSIEKLNYLKHHSHHRFLFTFASLILFCQLLTNALLDLLHFLLKTKSFTHFIHFHFRDQRR